MKYIKNKNHKWFVGHYLKKKLKDNYCIVLSQAYEGNHRFNGYCIGENCKKRTWQLNYFTKKFKYDKNKKDLCVPSNLKEDEYQINCVISTNSKYFTYNKKNNSCDAINNLNLGDEFKYIIDENNNNVAIILNTDNFKETHDFKPRKAYCENKWYDWITIPNYHFNNQYYKDSGVFSKDDVRKCYKPCGINLMPYTSIKDEELCHA